MKILYLLKQKNKTNNILIYLLKIMELINQGVNIKKAPQIIRI